MQQTLTATGRRLGYQAQDSGQTLGEGLAEYYAANAGRITRPADLPPASAALFRSHDTCHVIFGLDTSLADETLVDVRTTLSCDVGLRRYAAYLTRDPQAKALFQELGLFAVVRITLASTPRILRAAVEALRMGKRWPWVPPQSYSGRTLGELRREYRIRLI
ncbi:MAG TPA: hypothetical protein VHV27_12235 [Phenylobacterium sp.]|jgi:hypothetical protein|nr:hypothetical protein [Phenylobacterium sp.]